jgi:DNA-binding SARP family transcriptional activator
MALGVVGSRARRQADSHSGALRVHLTGAISLEAGDRVLAEPSLPGPLGRHLFAFLAAEHRRAISHDELASEIWHGAPPPAWASSLKALVSRTRSALVAAGFDGAMLAGAPGVYRLKLPPDAWVDIDAAKAAAHAAETHLRAGELQSAGQQAFVAKLITERPLFAGIAGPWAESRRAQLSDVRIRALQCSTRVELALGSFARAVHDARRAVELAPLREASWWLLMDAHAAAGDVASAIDAYERCRSKLDDELGIPPSATTRERHVALLAAMQDA